MEEKRKSKRYDLDASIVMERIDGSKNRIVPIEIIDASSTGIGFSCEEILEMGSVYKLRLKIWTGDTVDTFISIVRFDNSSDDNVYGGTFIGMPDSDFSRFNIHELFDKNK